ncbi:MAG: adenine phosphoribosyltransferase [Zetaproteobacteria bacterium CG12_big_fil_rev_8_21_14_0_65_55_1124]|nr:MAG: adenine phosphoribosyltransferase [Zetaproteobacteria bacterium CG08_land_8_20_14_0_20_55_17]PIW43737.1 MAG: adenine phosphoribosyltransferase [Zetaproteobacteria bacterium CG12_big_fil_rev_8_21_14_0_65_55_1124]PIY53273.1 MAG: adenine phosphoribosyltransferase [Zetaproteobacteria bacterium CG_4_10_14_0_8_um_filter_55_43]PIZ40155.1 MAG: adenine phosphoribosyltransferase [Zetaproteobacteria bacterium CG_4_10_14_0_2_um_filter_55_20]PJB82159.1 MAG: adenine phosphoribosyltransferase [Zetapro
MSGTKPAVNLCDYIRDIPDFPKPGIVFKDITPLLANGEAFCASISRLACHIPEDIDAIVGIESRGFLFGAGLSQHGCIGLVPVRKPGKLPADVHGIDYELEYGVDRLEIHRDSLSAGHRVVIVDDLLATGGTVRATIDLVRQLGAEVAACLFVVELKALGGRQRISDVPVHSLIAYD